jgi:hypothetical protein
VTYLYKEFGEDERNVQKETGLSLRKVRDFILIEAQATPKIKLAMKAGKVKPADVSLVAPSRTCTGLIGNLTVEAIGATIVTWESRFATSF